MAVFAAVYVFTFREAENMLSRFGEDGYKKKIFSLLLRLVARPPLRK